ncbi:uncharacterized protein N7473_002581 [Penicillium subrubescens]|uniref:Methyltransferase type 11 domain-containing protein n=1 Tax=Penicillium subrubescens TaxID=1316194 RepID=A0A1Q5UNT0_9EURO|nr:uncharacterized protein N7473_002581 [Penicillium subrubescens]KAJ5905665.1 hypothetical protein N7473_002581 [Penicillium subrubescens]OKP14132.1 hypothetical protein PENSUB_126 [Penicillium subrubescens]
MSSYNMGGRRMPPNDPFPPAHTSHPGPTNSTPAYGPRLPRPQLARPSNYTTRTDRAASLSAAEDSRSISALPPVPYQMSNHANRLSLLPRPSTGGTGSSPSPASTVSPHTPASSIPSSLSASDLTTPSPFTPSYQAPPANPPKRARNVLRRRAPTIGRHVEQNQSQKLSLVIPATVQPVDSREPRLPNLSDTYSAEPSSSSQSVSDRMENSAVDTPKIQEPVELASLRTTVDTQNLPPPPVPYYPSASTPSTRYSESPGMWSRGSTPTSLSSYSPGIMHSSKITRMRQRSPSQTRLPVFSPPSVQASPQSAQVEQADSKSQRSGLSKRSLALGSATITSGKGQSNAKSTPGKLQGPPHSPPPRKSSVNFSPPRDAPSKNPDIDIDQARKEVEEAERELFNSQRPRAPSISETSVPKVPKTPPRPSREGTHRLDLETSPVIQSNLPYLRSTGHKRRESMERNRIAQPPSAVASTDSLPSKNLSRIPSREAGSPVLARKSPKTLTKEPPKEKVDAKKPAAQKKFGLFSKKSKPDLDTAFDDQARPTRKGPAAGTGHEGYGKYSQRGRKSSASSASGVRTRSTSTTRSTPHSVASSKGSMSSSRPDLDLDDFLAARLEPVFISGGGMDGATLSRTVSEQSISSMSVTSSTLPRPTPLTSSTVQSTESLATSTGTFGDAGPRSESTTSLEPMRSRSPEKNQTPASRQQPKSRMPVPKGKRTGLYANTDATRTSTSLSSNTSSTVVPQRSKATPAATTKQKEPAKLEPPQPKKGKTSRWNLFQRSRSNEPSTTGESALAPPSHTAQLHAAISPVLNSRPIAHYALVDADSDELDDILNHVEDSPPTEEEPYIVPVEVPASLNIKKRHPSILLPSPPRMHGEFDRDNRPSPRTAMFNQNMMDPEPQSSPQDRRPRRLASIGRIPQVVSRRDRQHKPAMHSFSRPFSTSESPSVMAPTPEGTSEYPGLGGISLADIPSSKPGDWGYGFNPAFSAPEAASALEFLAGPYSAHELIHFSPHKGSPSSGSSGALAAVTAVVPKPGTAPTEDEVWNEYDDLIDVLSPEEPKSEETVKTEEDDRFEMATMASKALQDELNNDNSLQPPPFSPAGGSNRDSGDSVHLRRSRIVSALHSSIAPSTQASYSNLIASYGDPEVMYSPANPTQPSLDPVHEQQSTFLQSLAATPAPKPKPYEFKDFPGCSEREWDAVTRTNMRSASLMTSRWLSFGRVLFSPAHNHVKSGTHGRILVIDGLGNDDWSFYCSLTYPDAEVYSLSGRPVSTAIPHPAAWQPPTNHHTVYHAGLQNPLPFPKDYFAVAVLRFPAASSEAIQNNILQECRRVLRSGGYLEMSLLDRDMVNMGVRTRKAVRRLKEMTCLANSSISLAPTSDSIQRLIGTQGFDNLRRCMVRIPVAGMVVRSSGSTTSSSNKSLSASATTQSTGFSLPAVSVSTAATGSQSTQTASKSSVSDDNISLGDLLSDPSPSAANDESIAKIVARVGRWWYTKCYEEPALHDTGDIDLSMWNDRKVLRECQKRGTGFRMLIAYAQKPSEKRRTASV